MDRQRDLLVPYWLHTVRIGLVVTVLVLSALVIPAFLPGHGDYRSWPYFAILAVAAAGGATIALLPWRRWFDTGIGIRFRYAWSAADIVLVSTAIAVTGGGRSELFLVYGLTSVFSARPIRRRPTPASSRSRSLAIRSSWH
jgi:hypothetical protein